MDYQNYSVKTLECIILVLRSIFYQDKIETTKWLKAIWVCSDQLINKTIYIANNEYTQYTDKTIKKLVTQDEKIKEIFTVIVFILTKFITALAQHDVPHKLYLLVTKETHKITAVMQQMYYQITLLKRDGIQIFVLLLHLIMEPMEDWYDLTLDYGFITKIKNAQRVKKYEPPPDYLTETDPNKANLMATHALLTEFINQNTNYNPNYNRNKRSNNRSGNSFGVLFKKLDSLLRQKQLKPGMWRTTSGNGNKNKACVYFHSFGRCNNGTNCKFSHTCKCGKQHALKDHINSNNNNFN